MIKNSLDHVFLASAIFARELCTNRAILAFYNSENETGAAFEDLAWLVSLVETDLEMGVQGDVLLPGKPDQ